MVSRKRRTRVVFDANVVVAAMLSGDPESPNVAALKLWYVLRSLELVVSDEVVAEYFDVLGRLLVDEQAIERLARRLEARETVTWVNLGPRVVASRDPDDDALLSTAKAGRVAYLVTNDRDLLELTEEVRKRLRFQIVTPRELVRRLAEK